MNRKVITIVAGITATVFGGGALLTGNSAVKLENPQVVEWNKPTTDAEWAADVSAENFDIKSTGVLQSMVTSHTQQLAQAEKKLKKYTDCPDCIKYDFYQAFLTSGLNDQEAKSEADKAALQDTSMRIWEVEKLKQSIERMDNELRLRTKGFVVVEGDAVTFGATEKRIIRQIND